MKALVVYCHPNPKSFNAAVRDVVLAGLAARGVEHRLIDLYAENFNPVMDCAEREGYHTKGDNERPVATYLAHLRWCDTLIFVYPTWWYGPPAMLKGWLDRVWVPHAVFDMPEGSGPISGLMTNIKQIMAISTLGSPWWWWKVGMGEPGRKILLRGLPALCGVGCKRVWLGLHKMDSATEKQRMAFLKKVGKAIAEA
jgi:NAD(P)H dehydrogenase (quinone)